jgi:hypothetical protein
MSAERARLGGKQMNWQRGFFRVWVLASIIWIALMVWAGGLLDHATLEKPDIIVHWGKEDLVYPPGTSEEAIRADLQRRADKQFAEDEEQFRNTTPEQREYCEKNSNATLIQVTAILSNY